MARLRVFNRLGELESIESPKLNLSDEQWRKRLSSEQYQILRSKGTERPYCGTLLDNKLQGVYTCAGCGLPLFASDAKFHSGTGWPSFFQPIAQENILEHRDSNHGMTRIEIVCARCDGHLGHVFDDGPRPTGLRYCLNSESLSFTPSDQLATLAELADASASGEFATETAVLAGGCFWCTEAAFEQLAGVIDVESGYAGGAKDTANYEAVCSGQTGHAEAIRIQYDPATISFERLLDVFFDAHDPTQLNRQGNDTGTQYRSAIFVADDKQKRAAQKKIKELDDAKAFRSPIVTTLEPLVEFYSAEQYHQDYARKHPEQPYILHHSTPKACEIRNKYQDLVRHSS